MDFDQNKCLHGYRNSTVITPGWHCFARMDTSMVLWSILIRILACMTTGVVFWSNLDDNALPAWLQACYCDNFHHNSCLHGYRNSDVIRVGWHCLACMDTSMLLWSILIRIHACMTIGIALWSNLDDRALFAWLQAWHCNQFCAQFMLAWLQE